MKEKRMVRLTVRSQTPVEAVLQVDGWVAEEYVSLLEAEGERCLQQAKRLVLDLRGVRYLDEECIRLLQRWKGERLVLRGASPFIQVLLETYGLM